MTESGGRLYPESTYVVTITDTEVSCKRPDGGSETVSWDELRAVVLETTDEGPFAMDVFWILVGNGRGCIIPQGATGEQELIDRLQALPGFDNQAMIDAMACTENQKFLCWKK